MARHRWLRFLVVPILLAGCSSTPEPAASPTPEPSPTPVVMTAAEYWDEQGPAVVRELCVPIQFFDENVADLKYDHNAYEAVYEGFVENDYIPGSTAPSAEDAFAELLARCGV